MQQLILWMYQTISEDIKVKLLQKLRHSCYFLPQIARKIDGLRSIHVDSAIREDKAVTYFMQP